MNLTHLGNRVVMNAVRAATIALAWWTAANVGQDASVIVDINGSREFAFGSRCVKIAMNNSVAATRSTVPVETFVGTVVILTAPPPPCARADVTAKKVTSEWMAFVLKNHNARKLVQRIRYGLNADVHARIFVHSPKVVLMKLVPHDASVHPDLRRTRYPVNVLHILSANAQKIWNIS